MESIKEFLVKMIMDLKVGDKVLAKFKKYNTSVFEGTIEEINGDDISIRPTRCVECNNMELSMALKLKVLLGVKRKSIISKA